MTEQLNTAHPSLGVSEVGIVGKNLPTNVWDIRDKGWIPGLRRSHGGWHGSTPQYTLAWKIPWTEEPSRLQSVHACMLNVSRVQLFATPWIVVQQAPLSMGFYQARILDWVASFFFNGSSQPRDWTHISCVSCNGRRFFTNETLGKPGLQSVGPQRVGQDWAVEHSCKHPLINSKFLKNRYYVSVIQRCVHWAKAQWCSKSSINVMEWIHDYNLIVGSSTKVKCFESLQVHTGTFQRTWKTIQVLIIEVLLRY